MKEQVFITGLGVVSSIGKDVNAFQEALLTGKSCFGFIENKNTPSITPRIAALINGFNFDEALNKLVELSAETRQKAKTCASRSPLSVQASVISALQAWQDASLQKTSPSGDRTGLIIAGQNLSNNYQFGLHEKFINRPELLNPKYALHYLDTDHVGTISEILPINGEGFTLGGASASGNVALIKGYQLINHGILDACLVIGAMADLSPMDLQGFYNIGAYGCKAFADDPEKACRPFDAGHEGFVYGQGSGAVVLESSASVSRRGYKAYAQLLGGVINLDGNRMSDPNEDGEIKAMRNALQQAELTPADIDYINAHGSSSPLGDKTEASAFNKVFSNELARIWINSTKGITGHCLYAAGVVESIATVLQLKHGFIHPNMNLHNPIDDRCRFVGRAAIEEDIHYAMSNSFGFGGINSSIVLQKCD